MTVARAALDACDLTYAAVGGTQPGQEHWTPPPGWRAYERTVSIGRGPDSWEAASAAVLRWGVKTRSGFTVRPADVRVADGANSARPAVAGGWSFPVLLAQRWYRHWYLTAL